MESSPEISDKFGYFFEERPYLGLELEAFYTKPDFEDQIITLSHPGFSDLRLNSGDSFSEKQLGITVHSLTFALNTMFRYQKFKKITPCFGIGPSLTFWKMKGSGCSDYIIESLTPAYQCSTIIDKT